MGRNGSASGPKQHAVDDKVVFTRIYKAVIIIHSKFKHHVKSNRPQREFAFLLGTLYTILLVPLSTRKRFGQRTELSLVMYGRLSGLRCKLAGTGEKYDKRGVENNTATVHLNVSINDSN